MEIITTILLMVGCLIIGILAVAVFVCVVLIAVEMGQEAGFKG